MRLGVMGLGYVGLPLLLAAAEEEFEVVGFDVSYERINSLRNGSAVVEGVDTSKLLAFIALGRVELTCESSKLHSVDILVIAVPTPLDVHGEPDLSFLKSAIALIPRNLNPNALIISESTSHPGTLRNLIAPRIVSKDQNLISIDFAVAPERIDPNNQQWSLSNTPRVIGGLTQKATKRAADFYRSLASEVIEVDSPEIAEMSKLLENSFRLLNIAFINEFAVYCYEIGLNANDIINAASTKPFGFMQFRPSIGVGGHCIPVDPVYLDRSAQSTKISLELLRKAIDKKSNVDFVLRVLLDLFDGDLNKKKIQLVGLSYKANVADTRESPSIELLMLLRSRGVEVSWHDPLVLEWGDEVSQELSHDIDFGLILVNHEIVDLTPWKDFRDQILDFSLGSGTGFPTPF